MNRPDMTRDEALLFADGIEDEPKHWRTTADKAALVLAAEVRRQTAEIEALRMDARRYGWLRDPANMRTQAHVRFYGGLEADELDAAIDSVLRA